MPKISAARRRAVVGAVILGLIAVGLVYFLDRGEEPHGLVVDWPNAPVERTYFDTGLTNLHVAPLTEDGYDLGRGTRYQGDAVAFDQNVWMPSLKAILTSARNERPGEIWLIAIEVPSLDRRALTAIPLTPRGDFFSPMFAVDADGERLFVVDQQRFCAFSRLGVWHIWNAGDETWTTHPLSRHALVTLDYIPERDVLVGVGYDFEEKRRVVATFTPEGELVEQHGADVCAVLEPAQFGYDNQTIRSRLRNGIIAIERQLYYGEHAQDGQYWETQHIEVDPATGRITQIDRLR